MKSFLLVFTILFSNTLLAEECTPVSVSSGKDSKFEIVRGEFIPLFVMSSSNGVGEWSIDIPKYNPEKALLTGGVTFDESREEGEILIFDITEGKHIPRHMTWIGCH